MEDFDKIITTLKRLYIDFSKDAKDIDKHVLSNAFKRIAPYLELKSLEEIKKALNEATNKIYTVNGVLLSDEQIIEVEYQKVKAEYEKKSAIILNTNSDNIENQKLILVEYYFNQIKVFTELDKDKQKEHMGNIKLILTRISILLGIENGLYYETFLIFTECLGLKNILNNQDDKTTPRIGGK